MQINPKVQIEDSDSEVHEVRVPVTADYDFPHEALWIAIVELARAYSEESGIHLSLVPVDLAESLDV